MVSWQKFVGIEKVLFWMYRFVASSSTSELNIRHKAGNIRYVLCIFGYVHLWAAFLPLPNGFFNLDAQIEPLELEEILTILQDTFQAVFTVFLDDRIAFNAEPR